jgi:hypothetical protein
MMTLEGQVNDIGSVCRCMEAQTFFDVVHETMVLVQEAVATSKFALDAMGCQIGLMNWLVHVSVEEIHRGSRVEDITTYGTDKGSVWRVASVELRSGSLL